MGKKRVDGDGNTQVDGLDARSVLDYVAHFWTEAADHGCFLGVCLSRDGEAVKFSLLNDGERWQKWCGDVEEMEQALEDARLWLSEPPARQRSRR